VAHFSMENPAQFWVEINSDGSDRNGGFGWNRGREWAQPTTEPEWCNQNIPVRSKLYQFSKILDAYMRGRKGLITFPALL